jgi:drug/metabolite transporter (DMT)-like permease
MSRNVIVHEGLDSRYWLTVTGYSLIGILIAVFSAYLLFQSYNTGNSNVAYVSGGVIGIVSFAYSFGAAVSYGALFKDASYLRGQNRSWNPQWWKYIGYSLAIPTLAGIAATPFADTELGITVAILLHALTACVTSIAYIYHRHQRQGVP